LLVLFSFICVSCGHREAQFQEKSASWKFAVVSDTQGDNKREVANKTCINDAVVQAVACDIVREKPDLVIVAGDLIKRMVSKRRNRLRYSI
jgi:3',5'-cyclic AMP phosphodiesterase CpdA